MKKSDLKTGMILVSGQEGREVLSMVLLGTENWDIISGNTWMPLQDMTDGLVGRYGHTYFNRVYQPKKNSHYLYGGLNLDDCELIWERPTRNIVKVGDKEYYEDELSTALESIKPIGE